MAKLVRFIAQFEDDTEIEVVPAKLDVIDIQLERGQIVQSPPIPTDGRTAVVGQFMRLNVKAIVSRATTRLVLKEDNLPALREVAAAAELWRFHWSKVRPMQPEDEGFAQAVTLMLATELKLAQVVEAFSGPLVARADGGKVDG